MLPNAMPPLSLYVHMPWCVSKCPYCDFNSHALTGRLPAADYVSALLRDLDDEAERAAGRGIRTVFIGGGTPSLFPGAEIGRLMDGIRARVDLAPGCEVTMEANPGSVEHGVLGEYRSAGINRLSLGAQSFDADMLLRLGRIHAAEDTLRVFGEARTAGFDNINLDLMYGLPQQSVELAIADLEAACRLGPEHLSYYQLALEPNTVFHQRPPPLPDEDTIWEMMLSSELLLSEAGYRRYEVSAFARPGFACRHNLNYWRFGDYLALGAGAHGKLTDETGRVVRYRKPAHPRAYLQAAGEPRAATGSRTVAGSERVFEYFLNALRLTDGFDLRAIGEVGKPAREFMADKLRAAESRGLLQRLPEGRWQPTELGFRFLNDLQSVFLP